MNNKQKIMIVASELESLYINMNRPRKSRELDIDNDFKITAIKAVIYDDGNFYVLANKSKGKIGYYLFRMNEKRPIVRDENGDEHLNGEFMINWHNKLDIGDANLSVLRNDQKGFKELVVSYKCIYINTFNVNVIDLSDQLIIFRHESF